MKPIRMILIGLVAALTLAPVARAADPDDLEGETNAQPEYWEPVIAAFYIRPNLENVAPKAIKLDKKSALPGIRAAWLEIKQQVAIRTGAIPADQPVVSSWRLDRDEEQAENIAPFVSTTTGSETIPTLVKDQEFRVFVGIDVILTDPDRKEQILRDNFKVLEFEITKAIWISDDPKQFRAAAPPEAKPEGYFTGVNKAGNPFGADWKGVGGVTRSVGATSGRHPGVAEFRVKATISGKFSSQEKEQVKSVEGAIRIAFADQAVNLDRLTLESAKKDAGKKK
jgi:hypothetical protein